MNPRKALSKIPFTAVGGSGGELSLFSRDGIRLMKVDSSNSDFIWAVACREIAGKQEIISGDNEGHLRSHTVAYSRVHGMYRELYASREKLTSIRVRQLDKSIDESVLVPCREMISKIAISDDLLVCQSKDKVKIWSKISRSGEVLKYEQASVFSAPEKCNLLVCGGKCLCKNFQYSILSFLKNCVFEPHDVGI